MSHATTPPHPWLRWCGLIVGGIVFFWLPLEDQNLIVVQIIAVSLSCYQMFSYIIRKHPQPRFYKWIGVLGGLLIGPLAFLLMVFKIGLHNHPEPDFTIAEISRLFLVSPIWGVVGFMLGWGIQLIFLARSD